MSLLSERQKRIIRTRRGPRSLPFPYSTPWDVHFMYQVDDDVDVQNYGPVPQVTHRKLEMQKRAARFRARRAGVMKR